MRKHSWHRNGRALAQKNINKLQIWANRNLSNCSGPGQGDPGQPGKEWISLLGRTRRTDGTWVNSALSWQIRETTDWASGGLGPEGRSYQLLSSVLGSPVLIHPPNPFSTQNKAVWQKHTGDVAGAGWGLRMAEVPGQWLMALDRWKELVCAVTQRCCWGAGGHRPHLQTVGGHLENDTKETARWDKRGKCQQSTSSRSIRSQSDHISQNICCSPESQCSLQKEHSQTLPFSSLIWTAKSC